MAERVECIIVGSGFGGAHAAQTLLECGSNVLMLDVGIQDRKYCQIVPDADFIGIRRTDAEQHRYFLGDDFEGIPWGEAQHTLTPPRQFITRDVQRWLPSSSETFNPMESLAYGGLGNGWGAGCAAYSNAELREMGLDPGNMLPAYGVVASRIGVSAVADDVAPFCLNGLTDYQAPMLLDSNIDAFYRAYKKKRHRLNERGFFVGQPPLAVLTEDRDGRRQTQYNDMEFWTDAGDAVYRPRITVDHLRRHPRFRYLDCHLVTRFHEIEGGVRVEAIHTESLEKRTVECRRLLLAPGTLGTARIVMRSLPSARRLPILTNQYALAPCLHLRRLGAPHDERKTSMGQLVMYYDQGGSQLDLRMLAMYTYRSLLIFKLAKEIPFDLQTSTRFMRRLAPGLIIASVNHPDRPTAEKYVEMAPDDDSPTGDRLVIHYQLSSKEQAENLAAERQMFRALRSIGAYPLKKQSLQAGSSVHYAGCLPIGATTTEGNHLLPDGRLSGTQNVFVVDGSGFRYLPSNGLTFSIMANAHIVAQRVARGGS